MKYLKLFEDLKSEEFDIKIFTADEFYNFFMSKYGQNYDLKSKISYFNFDDLSSLWSSDKHFKTQRFIVAYNNKDILGISRFAWFEFSGYAMSYTQVNNDYRNKGISKMLLEKLFMYFSKNYSNEELNISAYTIDGWKYIRNTILNLSEKYNIKLREKAIEFISDWSEENRNLYKKSRKDIRNKYGKKIY